jgi:predicted enzyme related to lactoylglutathione lyase
MAATIASRKKSDDMKIRLTRIYVEDTFKAFNFYTQVLGFMQRYYLPDGNLAIVASPEEANGAGLLLEPNGNPIASTYQKALYDAKIAVIIFSVTNMEEEVDRLKSKGVVFTKEPTQTDWGTEAVFDDTCGNLIQLLQL